MSTDAERGRIIRNIVRAYDRPLVRLYGTIRCLILNRRFLDEIAQYFPDSGLVLDIGCGYGIFAQYYATLFPQLRIRAIDVNPRRIEAARATAQRLQLSNVEFCVGDACDFRCQEAIRGAYIMDLIHHMPEEAVPRLVRPLAESLEPGCRLIIKDIDTSPRYKLIYSWMVDKFMDYRAPVRYWSSFEVKEMLKSFGFEVYKHSLLSYLPSPHIVYIATNKQGPRAS